MRISVALALIQSTFLPTFLTVNRRLLAIALGLVVSSHALAAQKTVCTVTINSNDEEQAFKKNLSPKDFKFVELTQFDSSQQGWNRSRSQWFKKACDSKIQCDVLLVSAHFGGEFFGSTGFQLMMEPLEQNSCSNTCDGILKNPKEVFLFGCNTLAEKGKDRRTQAEYAQVLLEHGFERTAAETIAETRYGAAGATFKDRMRRVFSNVPHIYGFNSVSPSGAHVKPALDNYFASIPNYSEHLEKMQSATAPNNELAKAMAETAMTQTFGVGAEPGDAGIPFRDRVCSIYDTRKPLRNRTENIVGLLQSSDRPIFLDTAVTFFNQTLAQIKMDLNANAVLESLQSDRATLSAVDQLRTNAHATLAQRLNVLHLEAQLGAITTAQFQQSAIAMVRPPGEKLSAADADLLCSSLRLHGLHLTVSSDDFTSESLKSPSLIYALQCLDTADTRLTAAVLSLTAQSIKARNGTDIRAELLALTRLPGEAAKKIELANFISASGSHLRTYALGLLTTSKTGSEQDQAVRDFLQSDLNEEMMVFNMYNQRGRDSTLGESLLRNLTRSYGQDAFLYQLVAIGRTLQANSTAWSGVAALLPSLSVDQQLRVLNTVVEMKTTPPPLVNVSLQFLVSNQLLGFTSGKVLSQAALTPEHLDYLASVIHSSPFSGASGIARWLFSLQPQDLLTKQQRKLSRGPAYQVNCELLNSSEFCRGERVNIR